MGCFSMFFFESPKDIHRSSLAAIAKLLGVDPCSGSMFAWTCRRKLGAPCSHNFVGFFRVPSLSAIVVVDNTGRLGGGGVFPGP